MGEPISEKSMADEVIMRGSTGFRKRRHPLEERALQNMMDPRDNSAEQGALPDVEKPPFESEIAIHDYSRH